MSKLLKKTDGKLTRDQQARRYALVMLLPALIFLACAELPLRFSRFLRPGRKGSRLCG